MQKTPTQIEKFSPTEMLLVWNSGERFVVNFHDMRFECPCAACIDEHTGERILRRESIGADIHPTGVQLVGRYAVGVSWSDGHSTGMYHFDNLFKICKHHGHAT